MSNFIEDGIVWKDDASHGHPNECIIIEKANVSTNLTMNEINKRRSIRLESEDSKDTRMVVLTVSVKSKLFSFLAFPFLAGDQLNTIH